MNDQSSATGAVLPYDLSQNQKSPFATGAAIPLLITKRFFVTVAARDTKKNQRIKTHSARAADIQFLMTSRSSATGAVRQSEQIL